MSSDYKSLMYLGKLEKEYEVLGHKIVFKTLTSGDRLGIGKEQDILGPLSVGINTKISTLARSIVSIDGNSLYEPLREDEDIIQKKIEILRDKFYYGVLNEIFQAYLQLEEEEQKVFDEFKKKSKNSTSK